MKNIIEISDFCFSYPESEKKTLNNINMQIQEGSLNVLCGKSGCGKSTLLRQLKSVLALHGDTAGEILYNGTPIQLVPHHTIIVIRRIICHLHSKIFSAHHIFHFNELFLHVVLAIYPVKICDHQITVILHCRTYQTFCCVRCDPVVTVQKL